MIQAGGTDSGPRETAAPTFADGVPTRDERWNGNATGGRSPGIFPPITIRLPSTGARNGLSPFRQPNHIELRLDSCGTRKAWCSQGT